MLRRGPRHRRLNEDDDHTDALETTLWYPHLRPSSAFHYHVTHAITKQHLGLAQPAKVLLEDDAYTAKHLPPFTQAWLFDRETDDVSVWAVVLALSRCGELCVGEDVCLTKVAGQNRVIMHGRVLGLYYRPRDNRTAWAEIVVHEVLDA